MIYGLTPSVVLCIMSFGHPKYWFGGGRSMLYSLLAFSPFIGLTLLLLVYAYLLGRNKER